MNKNLLITIIKLTNVNAANSYLNKIGYNFSYEEINLLLPYLKLNTHLLEKDKKDLLISNIPYPISSYCKYQLIKLFDQFI